MTRMGFVFNLDACLDMRGCTVACQMYRQLPVGIYHTETKTVSNSTYPDVNQYFIPIICQQCDRPTCLDACTERAIIKMDNGIVMIANQAACAACIDAPCQDACPYDAIHHDPKTGKTYKCDMCVDRLARGESPCCVENCLAHARIPGDLDDPESAASQWAQAFGEYAHKLKPETGNGPNVYYLLSKHGWVGSEGAYAPAWHDA